MDGPAALVRESSALRLEAEYQLGALDVECAVESAE